MVAERQFHFTAHNPDKQNPDTYRQFVELQRVLQQMQQQLDTLTARVVPVPVEIVGGSSTSGSQWIVVGNMLIQWGRFPPTTGTQSITFAQPFKSIPFVVDGQLGTYVAGNDGTGVRSRNIVTRTATGFTTFVKSTFNFTDSVSSGDWIAIGEAPDALVKPTTVNTIGDAS